MFAVAFGILLVPVILLIALAILMTVIGAFGVEGGTSTGQSTYYDPEAHKSPSLRRRQVKSKAVSKNINLSAREQLALLEIMWKQIVLTKFEFITGLYRLSVRFIPLRFGGIFVRWSSQLSVREGTQSEYRSHLILRKAALIARNMTRTRAEELARVERRLVKLRSVVERRIGSFATNGMLDVRRVTGGIEVIDVAKDRKIIGAYFDPTGRKSEDVLLPEYEGDSANIAKVVKSVRSYLSRDIASRRSL